MLYYSWESGPAPPLEKIVSKIVEKVEVGGTCDILLGQQPEGACSSAYFGD